VTLFRAEERDGTLADALTIWREVARGGLVVEEVRGGHNEMLIEPNVEVLAERLSARLTDDAVVVREDQLPALRSAEMSRRTATTV
jgi:thioesterase domain-containing protein